jgi:hypothetical protein
MPPPIVLCHVTQRGVDSTLSSDGVGTGREELGDARGFEAGFGCFWARAGWIVTERVGMGVRGWDGRLRGGRKAKWRDREVCFGNFQRFTQIEVSRGMVAGRKGRNDDKRQRDGEQTE